MLLDGMPEDAVAGVMSAVRAGVPVPRIIDVIASVAAARLGRFDMAAAEDNSTASIMVAHAVKTTTAAITESAVGGRAPLAAAARFLAAPKRARFVYQATLDAIDFIQGRAKGDASE